MIGNRIMCSELVHLMWIVVVPILWWECVTVCSTVCARRRLRALSRSP